MTSTILYLLRSDFVDTQAGNTAFYCPQCLPVEGLLAVFPVLPSCWLQIVRD
ncbi:DUF3088 family protein [Rhodobacteraceae bacterium B1Z28]|uniref:DUF3088 family protein n=1 Tax=Ruegeria haliotis TaxID=2747601 RepID=A0ABX2PSI2_9RHOB|nr:DUF3088 family protein [Ruegeria haliotis]